MADNRSENPQNDAPEQNIKQQETAVAEDFAGWQEKHENVVPKDGEDIKPTDLDNPETQKARDELEKIIQDYNAIAPEAPGLAEEEEEEEEEKVDQKGKEGNPPPKKMPGESDKNATSITDFLFESLKKAANQMGLYTMLRKSPPGRMIMIPIEKKIKQNITDPTQKVIKDIKKMAQDNIVNPTKNLVNKLGDHLSKLAGTPKDPNNLINTANTQKQDRTLASKEETREEKDAANKDAQEKETIIKEEPVRDEDKKQDAENATENNSHTPGRQ